MEGLHHNKTMGGGLKTGPVLQAYLAALHRNHTGMPNIQQHQLERPADAQQRQHHSRLQPSVRAAMRRMAIPIHPDPPRPPPPLPSSHPLPDPLQACTCTTLSPPYVPPCPGFPIHKEGVVQGGCC
jgi:hypothetical protein